MMIVWSGSYCTPKKSLYRELISQNGQDFLGIQYSRRKNIPIIILIHIYTMSRMSCRILVVYTVIKLTRLLGHTVYGDILEGSNHHAPTTNQIDEAYMYIVQCTLYALQSNRQVDDDHKGIIIQTPCSPRENREKGLSVLCALANESNYIKDCFNFPMGICNMVLLLCVQEAILYSNLQSTMGPYFLDTQYI